MNRHGAAHVSVVFTSTGRFPERFQMTTTQWPQAEVDTPSVDRRMTGRIVLFGFVAVNAAIVTVLFVLAGPADNILITVGMLVGLYATVVLELQLLLIARVPWLD